MFFDIEISDKDRAKGRYRARFHKSFADAAVKQKKRYRITQNQVAERADIDKASLSKILRGIGNPTLDTIVGICWAMDLEPTFIFEDLGEKVGGKTNHVVKLTADAESGAGLSDQVVAKDWIKAGKSGNSQYGTSTSGRLNFRIAS